MNTPQPEMSADVDVFVTDLRDRRREAYKLVSELMDCAFSRAKRRYDARVKAMNFQPGDFVYFYCPKRRLRRNPKWQLMSTGPHLVERKVNNVNYIIRMTLSFYININILYIMTEYHMYGLDLSKNQIQKIAIAAKSSMN